MIKKNNEWSCPRCGQDLLDDAQKCPNCKLILPSFLSETDRQQWLEQVKETARREEEAKKQEGLRRKKEEELRQQEELRKKREQEARQRVEPQKVDPSPQKNKDKTERPSLDSQHSGKNAEKKERATPRTIAIWGLIIFFLSLLLGIGSYQYFIISKKTSDTGNEKKKYVVVDPTKSQIPENLNNNHPASNTLEARYNTAESLYENKDYELAILEFQKIIEENPKHSFAPKALYYQGLAFEKTGDQETALIIFNKLIDTYPKSQEVGLAKKSIESLRPTLNKSSECQNFLKDRPDPKDIEAWRKAADEGDAWSQYCVGVLYEHGWGVTQDYTKAVEWYRKAEKQGHLSARYNIGRIYDTQENNSERLSPEMVFEYKWDKNKNIEYRSVKSKFTGASHNNFKKNGDGTVSDVSTGLMWVEKALTKGFTHGEALMFCNNLNFAGYSDWRLPTLQELSSILAKEKNSKGVYLDNAFSGYSWFWSINKRTGEDSWYIDFSKRRIYYGPDYDSGFVRPVRTESYINSSKNANAVKSVSNNIDESQSAESPSKKPTGSPAIEARYNSAESLYENKDYELAILEFQKIIEENPKHSLAPKALYKQGLAFEKTRDQETALIIFNKLIDTYPKSQEVGLAKKSIESLRPTLNKSSECQNFLKDSPDPKDIKAWRKAADEGDAWSQYCVGVLYEHGWGVTQDYIKALDFYWKATEQGHADAQNNLGVLYSKGEGVAQDYMKALEWYRKAAEQGHADAQCNLGVMYYKGIGVALDDMKAVEWFRKAAEQGYARAQYNLGVMYTEGRGVALDDVKALEWYRKAAEQRHAGAQNNLGVMYYKGIGVALDDTIAAEWFQKAAEQGNADAQKTLGWMYKKGRGVAQDDTMAAEWFQKAAEQGNR